MAATTFMTHRMAIYQTKPGISVSWFVGRGFNAKYSQILPEFVKDL
jgi:hypothetical protein